MAIGEGNMEPFNWECWECGHVNHVNEETPNGDTCQNCGRDY